MKTFVLSFVALCALVAASVSGEYTEHEARELYTSFLAKYEKTYATNDVEFNKRFGIFKENLKRIDMANRIDGSAEHGITRFADLTPDEFHNRYLMPEKNPEELRSIMGLARHDGNRKFNDLPDSFDWRDEKAVSPVKNQGACGSCWAFSTVANIESVNFLKTKNMQQFSEQTLVDCDHTCDPKDPSTCDGGCNGGLMLLAMRYVKENGLPSEDAYPYTARDGTCKYSKGNETAIQISGFKAGPTDADDIASFLMEHGVLSVAVNAEWLQFYIGGISDPLLCSPKSLNHGVAIVGFGKGKNMFGHVVPYWIVKNSWGSSWGEDGYFRIKRGADTCGIESYIATALMD